MKFQWTRKECDDSFHDNMVSLCKLKDAMGRKSTYSWISLWKKLRHIFIVINHLSQWIQVKPQSLDHCLKAADVYYRAVRGFGQPNFNKVAAPMCKYNCAKPLGNPLIKI